MLYIYNPHIDPYYNLACEEYLLKEFNNDIFMLWRNSPSIIVGKNQNALSEINIDFVKSNQIPVVRRLSGGGAVFHDLGNLNFTFISNSGDRDFNDFKRFTQPIIDVLKELSIDAEFSGRNDITIDGKKISGNAQYGMKKRMLHHGTLLFSSEISDISSALNVKQSKFDGKAIKSVSSRVTNISSHLKRPLSIIEFKDKIMEHIKNSGKDGELYSLSNDDKHSIQKLADEKYSTWEWNFGSSPRYTFKNEKRFPYGGVEVYLDVEKGTITSAKIYGDFFGKSDISILEGALSSIKHNESDLRNALSKIDIGDFISGAVKDELIFMLCNL